MHIPHWVACSERLPTNTRLYVGKLVSGQTCKAQFKRGKGGFWDFFIYQKYEKDPTLEYWLCDFPPKLISNLDLKELESHLKELELC